MAYIKTIWNNDMQPCVDSHHLSRMEDGILNSVCKDGDTMNGSLYLNYTPIKENGAINKVDAETYIKEYFDELEPLTLPIFNNTNS